MRKLLLLGLQMGTGGWDWENHLQRRHEREEGRERMRAVERRSALNVVSFAATLSILIHGLHFLVSVPKETKIFSIYSSDYLWYQVSSMVTMNSDLKVLVHTFTFVLLSFGRSVRMKLPSSFFPF